MSLETERSARRARLAFVARDHERGPLHGLCPSPLARDIANSGVVRFGNTAPNGEDGSGTSFYQVGGRSSSEQSRAEGTAAEMIGDFVFGENFPAPDRERFYIGTRDPFDCLGEKLSVFGEQMAGELTLDRLGVSLAVRPDRTLSGFLELTAPPNAASTPTDGVLLVDKSNAAVAILVGCSHDGQVYFAVGVRDCLQALGLSSANPAVDEDPLPVDMSEAEATTPDPNYLKYQEELSRVETTANIEAITNSLLKLSN